MNLLNTQDLLTAPSSFLLTIISLLFLLCFAKKGTKFTKEGVNQSVDKL